MAAPASATSLDISGVWVMNKSLSEKPDEVLALQGVGFLVRKTVGLVTITQTIKHFKDDKGIEHMVNDQSFAGGLASTKEERAYSGVREEHEDHLYGPILNMSERCKVSDLKHEYLRTNWTEDTIEHGVLHTVSESNTAKSGKTWVADQAWGFELVNGERRYTRRIKFTGPGGEDLEVRMVHDYMGPLPA